MTDSQCKVAQKLLTVTDADGTINHNLQVKITRNEVLGIEEMR